MSDKQSAEDHLVRARASYLRAGLLRPTEDGAWFSAPWLDRESSTAWEKIAKNTPRAGAWLPYAAQSLEERAAEVLQRTASDIEDERAQRAYCVEQIRVNARACREHVRTGTKHDSLRLLDRIDELVERLVAMEKGAAK